MRIKTCLVLFFLFIAAVGQAGTTGSAFTYQGELTQLGARANGAFDFEFELFDMITGGTSVGGPVQLEDVAVVDGVFTVELDFGSAPFDGNQLWLRLGVREGTSTGAYTSLSPRQKLTTVPYALTALNDADRDPANEIQDLELSGNTLSLTGDPTTVDLSIYLDDTDDQTLSEVLAQGNDAGGQSISNVGNLTATGTTTTGALTVTGLDCTGNANGGALTADANGVVSCSDDDDSSAVTLDAAYDQGGPGAGRTIIADAGPVVIEGDGGLVLDSGNLDQLAGDPLLLGSVGIGTNPFEVHVSGRYAYVVDEGSDDLKVIDVSDPGAPEQVGGRVIGTFPLSVYVSGRYAYVVDRDSNDLKVIDVSDPSAPSVAGSLGIGNFPRSVFVAGRYAYVVDVASNDLKVIDVSDPSAPTLAGSLAIGDFPRSVFVAGRYAYVVDEGSDDLKVIDVSDPGAPELVGRLAIGTFPVSVYVSGRYAYVVDRDSNDLKVIDVSDPSGPSVAGSLTIGNFPRAVFVAGRYAYVVDAAANDFKVIDVSDPSAPSVAGTLAIGDFPRSVFVSGRYAYVVDGISDDLKVIDISDPTGPILAGMPPLSIGSEPFDVYVSGRYAYVVDEGSEDLRIIDVSDPSAPILAGSLALGTFPRSVHVSGSYAYVVDEETDDLKVIDVSDPTAPVIAGSLALGLNARDVYVSGRYAYVVDSGSQDLKVIDVSGAEVTSAIVHSLEAGNLQVRNDIIAQGQLQVTGGVNVGSGGIFSDGDVGIDGRTTINGTVAIANDTPPTSSPANIVQLFAQDGVGGTSELRVRDEAGNVTTLSPHNFSLIGAPSEPMAWSFYSEDDHGQINVDMLRAVRLVEQLSGEKLVHIRSKKLADRQGRNNSRSPSALSPHAEKGTTGSAITFQGELNQHGVRASGAFDFRFELFDLAADGSPLGSAVVLEDVSVVDGVFTAELDFGPTPFSGDQLWLEIGVREGTSFGGFTVLPRRKLTAAAYALHTFDTDADEQDLALSGNTLNLSNDPTPVDLSGYLDNNDAQDLDLSGNTLSLTNDATTVDLSGYLDNTDSQDLAAVLAQGGSSAQSVLNVLDLDSFMTLTTALVVTELDCTGHANDGALTTDASGVVTCSDDDDGGGPNSLDGAYDEGGAGVGRTISADSGAVMIEGEGGLMLDAGDLQQFPGDPVRVGTLEIGEAPMEVLVSGRYAYVMDQVGDDLKVIDVSIPSAPSLVGSLAIGANPTSLYVSGRYAYVVSDSLDDLKVIDVSDPSAPSLVNRFLIDSPHRVYVSGRYAYVTGGPGGLQVIDVSDPGAPSLAGSLANAGGNDLFVSGRYAYVTGGDELKVIDVSDPNAPMPTGGSLAILDAISVDVSGRYAYVISAFSDDLNVVDVSDPGAPSLIGSLAIGGFPFSVHVSGRYAYVVDWDANDLKVIDISGAEITSVIAHSLEAGSLQVRNDIIAQGQLQVSSGFNIGSGGLFSGGAVGIDGRMTSNGTVAIANDTIPTSSPANLVQLYAEDVAGSSELKVRDEDGNITTLSPHNFSLIGAPSEPMAWSFYSENDGGQINVDMLRFARLIERLSGEKLVHIRSKNPVGERPPPAREN